MQKGSFVSFFTFIPHPHFIASDTFRILAQVAHILVSESDKAAPNVLLSSLTVAVGSNGNLYPVKNDLLFFVSCFSLSYFVKSM